MAEISGLSFGDGNDLTLNKDELKKELKKTDFKEEKMQTVFEKFFDKKTTDGKLDAYGLTKTSFGVNNSKAAYEMTYPLFRDKINEFNKKHE